MTTTNFRRVSADDLNTTIEAGVERASAARELTVDEIGAISGGAAPQVNSLFRINRKWLGIWPEEFGFLKVWRDHDLGSDVGAHLPGRGHR